MEHPPSRPAASTIRILGFAQAAGGWIMLGLSVWFEYQIHSSIAALVLAFVALTEPFAGWLIVNQLQRQQHAADTALDGGQAPPTPDSTRQITGALILAGGLGAALLAWALILVVSDNMFYRLPLYGLWALDGLVLLLFAIAVAAGRFFET